MCATLLTGFFSPEKFALTFEVDSSLYKFRIDECDGLWLVVEWITVY